MLRCIIYILGFSAHSYLPTRTFYWQNLNSFQGKSHFPWHICCIHYFPFWTIILKQKIRFKKFWPVDKTIRQPCCSEPLKCVVELVSEIGRGAFFVYFVLQCTHWSRDLWQRKYRIRWSMAHLKWKLHILKYWDCNSLKSLYIILPQSSPQQTFRPIRYYCIPLFFQCNMFSCTGHLRCLHSS